MNKWTRWKKINCNCSGQALLELAIFGSIIFLCLNMLLQFGVEANYRQFMQMTAFRRALSLSVNRRSVGGNPQASVTMISDNFIPSADDPFHLRQFSPYTAQVTAVYSNTLYRDYTPYAYNITSTEHLPSVDIAVNEAWLLDPKYKIYLQGKGYKECTQASPDGCYDDEIAIGDFVNTAYRDRNDPRRYARNLRGSYTTSGFLYVPLPCGSAYYKIFNNHYAFDRVMPQFRQREILSGSGKWWQWKDVNCESKDRGNTRMLEKGARVDVDNDCVEETIADVVYGEDFKFHDGLSGNQLLGWVVLDVDAGDINFVYGKPNLEKGVREPYTVTETDAKGNKREVIVSQGLQPDYAYSSKISPYKNAAKGTYTQHAEDSKQVTTAFGVHQDTTAKRVIKLNPMLDVSPWWPPAVPLPPEKIRNEEIKSERTLHQEEEFGESTPF